MHKDQSSSLEKHQILSLLAGLPLGEAIRTLNSATSALLEKSTDDDYFSQPVRSNLSLIRERGMLSKIERDPEVRAYLHSLPCAYTIAQLADACKKKFGAERAPASTSVHRYIQRLKSRQSIRGEH